MLRGAYWAPRRPILMVSPSTAALLGSPRMQWSKTSPRSAAHLSSFTVPFTAMLSSSPVIRNEIDPLGLPPRPAGGSRGGGPGQGDRTFHIHRAAAIERAVGDLAGKRRVGPFRLLARRHHVGVAGENEVRA